MKTMVRIQYVLGLWGMVLIVGCSEPVQTTGPEAINPTDTIGSISSYYTPGPVFVRGIGIVAGLAGTGSSECPPNIRPELEKYIWKQVTQAGSVNPKVFIESQNTAVVEISGCIRPYSTSNDRFDVILRPLSSTQTTSLDGGYLYTAELKEVSRLSSVEQFTRYTKTLATAEGPVYTKYPENSQTFKKWYVLGAGTPKTENSVTLVLNNPSFVAASAIRNRINERFGPKTATAISAAEIRLSFPLRYLHEKQHFLSIVQTLVLGNAPDVLTDHAQTQVQLLQSKTSLETTEDTLEGIGKPALDLLAPLLENPDPEIRFSAARCMLRIGDDRPIPLLRSLVLDASSPYRLDAIRVVGQNAKRRDALTILKSALNDQDTAVRLPAYEMLVLLNSPDISRKTIAKGSFTVDNVICGGPKMIYAYRQGTSRIVLFGSPIYCENNVFIQSEDLSVTINSPASEKYIAVSRKHPQRPRVIGPLTSSAEMSVLIQTLGEFPETESNRAVRPGLAVPYSDILLILKKMCDQGAVPAQFLAGPEPEIEPVLQNSAPNGR